MTRARAGMWLAGAAAMMAVSGGAVARLEAEDPAAVCMAVAVLNGDQPARADSAAGITRSGLAMEVWLTNDPRSAGGRSSDAGTASNMRRLVGHGVPAAMIRILDGDADSTRAELAIIRAAAARRAARCVIVVTSPAHVARVRLTWRTLPRTGPSLVVRHAANAGYAGWVVRARELILLLPALVGRPW